MLRYTLLLFVLFAVNLSYSQVESTANNSPNEILQIVRQPYLQQATKSSMIVRWRTSEALKGVVRYGTSIDRLSKRAKGSPKTTEHVVNVKGLQPNTKYYYAIEDPDRNVVLDSTRFFYTLPKPGTTGLYRIGIFGDCGTNSKPQFTARDMFLKYLGNDYLNAWMLLGDNAYPDGTDENYQSNFFDIYKNDMLKNYPLFPAPGNHDYRELTKPDPQAARTKDVSYFKNFTVPVKGESGGVPSNNESFYSYDIGNAHFISLDSFGEDDGQRMYDTLSPQVEWLKKDLEFNKNKGWVIVYWHHPPYTMGSHDSDKEEELVRIRQEFLRVLERYDVDLVLCGHSHTYERTKLMKGYYGMEADFAAEKYNLSSSTGLYNGTANSCPYIKSAENGEGTVYVVTGSAGKIGKLKESWPHTAMYFSDAAETGASILEIQENRLDLKWITSNGNIGDQFTMMKDVNKKTIITAKKGKPLILNASFVGNYTWNDGKSTSRGITVYPKPGTTVYTVSDLSNCVQDTFEIIVKD